MVNYGDPRRVSDSSAGALEVYILNANYRNADSSISIVRCIVNLDQSGRRDL